MRIYREKNYEAMSQTAANIVAAQVKVKPDCLLGLATGSSPVGMYGVLAEKFRRGELDFSKVRSVNLDEYVGLAAWHPQSYRYFMRENLFSHVNIEPSNTHLPDGTATDPEEECRRYDRILEELGRVDLQVLGLGHNGHIGFNEPGDIFEKSTHVVNLQDSTIQANARFFDSFDQVPRRAITMGIASIMRARCILLLVSGESKAEIVKTALTGDITPRVPASVLQLHPNVMVVGDEEALKYL